MPENFLKKILESSSLYYTFCKFLCLNGISSFAMYLKKKYLKFILKIISMFIKRTKLLLGVCINKGEAILYFIIYFLW